MSALDNTARAQVVERMLTDDFAYINRYWNDPVFRAEQLAESDARRCVAHAAIDRGMAGLNALQAARWDAEGRS